MAYKKCPRCELNYILDTEQYCKVCLVDMGKIAGAPLEDMDDEDLKLCPECGENYLEEGEELCYACRLEQMKNAAKEDDTTDSLDFDEDFVVPVSKGEPEEVLMEDLSVLEEGETNEDEEEE